MTNNSADFSHENQEQELRLSTGPGHRLQQRRVHVGLSVSEVAARLHLRACIIEAIENDDYEALPEFVFIRGYLRAYSSLLGINSDEVIEAFHGLNLSEPKADKNLMQTRKSMPRKERPFRWLSSIVVVCLVAVLGSWWHAKRGNPNATGVALTSAQDTLALSEREKAITTAQLSPPSKKSKAEGDEAPAKSERPTLADKTSNRASNRKA